MGVHLTAQWEIIHRVPELEMVVGRYIPITLKRVPRYEISTAGIEVEIKGFSVSWYL